MWLSNLRARCVPFVNRLIEVKGKKKQKKKISTWRTSQEFHPQDNMTAPRSRMYSNVACCYDRINKVQMTLVMVYVSLELLK